MVTNLTHIQIWIFRDASATDGTIMDKLSGSREGITNGGYGMYKRLLCLLSGL